MWVVLLIDVHTTCCAVCQAYYSIPIDSKSWNQEYTLGEDCLSSLYFIYDTKFLHLGLGVLSIVK